MEPKEGENFIQYKGCEAIIWLTDFIFVFNLN